MIVKMKKLTLLCTRASQKETLDILRDLGAVHLTHVKTPEGDELDRARNHLECLQSALDVLQKDSSIAPSGMSAHEVVDAVWELIRRKKELSEKIGSLEIERARYELFGAFSVDDIRQLEAQGVFVKLLITPIKQLPAEPDGAKLVELGRDKRSAYFALIGQSEVEIEAEELPLPECSAVEMVEQLSAHNVQVAETEEKFNVYFGDHESVAELMEEASDQVFWLEAREGMGVAEEVTYLKGFFPAEKVSDFRTVAEKQGWALMVEEPSATDHVPTS